MTHLRTCAGDLASTAREIERDRVVDSPEDRDERDAIVRELRVLEERVRELDRKIWAT